MSRPPLLCQEGSGTPNSFTPSLTRLPTLLEHAPAIGGELPRERMRQVQLALSGEGKVAHRELVAEPVELSGIDRENLLQHFRIFVCRRPDPEIRDVAIVRHLVWWISPAGHDHGVHVRSRPVRSTDDVSRKMPQQLMREGQRGTPIFRPRRSRI